MSQPKPVSLVTKVGDTNVEFIEVDDITSLADASKNIAFVNPTNENLKPLEGKHGIDASIHEAAAKGVSSGDESLMKELENNRDTEFPPYGILMTKGYGLGDHVIFHVNSPDGLTEGPDYAELNKMYQSTLSKADAQGVEIIVIPNVGTSSDKAKKRMNTRTRCEAIKQWLEVHETPGTKIKRVIVTSRKSGGEQKNVDLDTFKEVFSIA